jgi:hypothetical protein
MSTSAFRILALLILAITITHCSHYDQLQKHGEESSFGSTESHNFGQDCMTCHQDAHNEASKEGGWWNIAGSVNDEAADEPFTNGVIELWSQQDRQGTLYYTLEIDALGNFYTEKIVNFNGTCFPVVVNKSTGEYEAMEQAFHSGGCNSCHGDTEDLIAAP